MAKPKHVSAHSQALQEMQEQYGVEPAPEPVALEEVTAKKPSAPVLPTTDQIDTPEAAPVTSAPAQEEEKATKKASKDRKQKTIYLTTAQVKKLAETSYRALMEKEKTVYLTDIVSLLVDKYNIDELIDSL